MAPPLVLERHTRDKRHNVLNAAPTPQIGLSLRQQQYPRQSRAAGSGGLSPKPKYDEQRQHDPWPLVR
jgi:hypothetical protein